MKKDILNVFLSFGIVVLAGVSGSFAYTRQQDNLQLLEAPITLEDARSIIAGEDIEVEYEKTELDNALELEPVIVEVITESEQLAAKQALADEAVLAAKKKAAALAQQNANTAAEVEAARLQVQALAAEKARLEQAALVAEKLATEQAALAAKKKAALAAAQAQAEADALAAKQAAAKKAARQSRAS